jgi:hypothetical protein
MTRANQLDGLRVQAREPVQQIGYAIVAGERIHRTNAQTHTARDANFFGERDGRVQTQRIHRASAHALVARREFILRAHASRRIQRDRRTIHRREFFGDRDQVHAGVSAGVGAPNTRAA